ncbi:DNA methylase, N-6 adenine-specific, conserved site [Penicillium camemberti]|uniref:DNA methylase, N-6 adenine-specific, conserved site n=1 Tax=Penicillium camemberti (strain FM 013) TaxID=1429867 RepID=A0A0G4PVB7_PENC3|nr:DNA methylase, N-6 adenine-specific, conserved site [Penicillium camemberti]
MPRIPFSVIRKAQRENHLLPVLLKECRTIDSARNELRWLRERAVRDSQSLSRKGWRSLLRSMCQMRSRGYPLQYILGDQPFGDLEILCRRGVLIPRPETESYTYQAAKLVRQMALGRNDKPESPNQTRPLRVIDLCTGTGCIPLLLHALLAPHFQLEITGVDISPTALILAQKNLEHNLKLGHLASTAGTDIHFYRADVLGYGSDNSVPSIESILQTQPPKSGRLGISSPHQKSECDLLISNPPYISQTEFRNGTTARSVRRFEPKLALVPPHSGSGMEDCMPEDIFYHRILTLAFKLKAKLTVLECGDSHQANRVVALHKRLASAESGQFTAEVWPSREQDLAENGFHATDGSRGVIIQALR